MSFFRLLCVVLTLVVFARAELGVGDTRELVVRTLPKPTSIAKRGDHEIFMFPRGARIEFVDGKIADIRGPLPAPIADAAAVTDETPATAPARATPPPKPAVAAAAPAPKSAPPVAAPAPHGVEAQAVKSPAAALEKAGVKTTPGPATVPLGTVAEFKLAPGLLFIGKDSIAKFYELSHNRTNGKEVGVVVGPSARWMLYFDYNDVGYVKDEDKDKLDGDKLLSALTDGQDQANEERKSRGWDQLKLKGWATPPHYDPVTHNLKWAINLASSEDNYSSTFINESIRLLGREGVMNVTLVTEPPLFKQAEIDTDKLLAGGFGYISGHKYAEFKTGDKVAAYGLGALVLGGAGVMAAKAGLFSKLGVLMVKAWKLVVALFVGIAAAIKKLFQKITGRKTEEPPAAT